MAVALRRRARGCFARHRRRAWRHNHRGIRVVFGNGVIRAGLIVRAYILIPWGAIRKRR
jgi:hypothetical protein